MGDYAVVTGGGRNIGAAICMRLKSDGFRVICVDRIKPEHDRFDEAIELDLSDQKGTERVFRELSERFQPTRLVNNAGIVMPASLEDFEIDSLNQVMGINVLASIIASKALLSGMKAKGIGRIVNISSRAALGKELRTAYAASKAALIGLTKTWALELGCFGITVNAIGPGPIKTSLFDKVNPEGSPRTKKIIEAIPVKRMGTPEDVADAVSYFVSDRAAFTTGQVLYVCGGMTIGDA